MPLLFRGVASSSQTEIRRFTTPVLFYYDQSSSVVDGEVDPPVPIPNTVVKRFSTDGTTCASAWENRPPPGTSSRDGAAEARRAHNPKVGGSNPPPATS